MEAKVITNHGAKINPTATIAPTIMVNKAYLGGMYAFLKLKVGIRLISIKATITK
jgi:hypothetical protein